MFITFEGPDGGGKTTQVRLLSRYLQEAGYSVVCTREPGGTKLGDAIRSLLLDPAYPMCSRTEALLYMAARAEHVEHLIGPALAGGQIVISDRYADSTFVYQGVARNLSREDLALINQFAVQGLSPDLTFVLDGAAEVLCQRIQGRGASDRLEQENIEFHRQVRRGFVELAEREPERVKLIDGCAPVEQIHQEIVRRIAKILPGRTK